MLDTQIKNNLDLSPCFVIYSSREQRKWRHVDPSKGVHDVCAEAGVDVTQAEVSLLDQQVTWPVCKVTHAPERLEAAYWLLDLSCEYVWT